MSIASITGLRENIEGCNGLLEILEELGMEQDLSERSRIIAAVHEVFDNLEDLADESEFQEAFVESMAGLRLSELTRAEGRDVRERMKVNFTRVVTRIEVAMIDAQDRIDTGIFRADVETAPWNVTR